MEEGKKIKKLDIQRKTEAERKGMGECFLNQRDTHKEKRENKEKKKED